MGQTNFFINFTEFELDFTRKILFSLLILLFVHWVKFEWRIKIEQKSLFRLHVSSYPPFKYIYVYTHIHIYNETKSIEPRNYTMAMILRVRCAFKRTYTPHHTTHTHTHHIQTISGNFLICIVIFFFSLSSAYCSTYRYVLFFIKSIDPPSPPLLHAILHVYYSPRINIKYFTLLGNVAATMVRGIIIIQQRRKGKNFGNRRAVRLIRWTR